MGKRNLIIFISAIILITAALVIYNISKDTINDENAITLSYNDKVITVQLKNLDCGDFSGTLINGKGDESQHMYSGVELKVLLEQEEIDLESGFDATVLAQDQYSAELTWREITEPGKVYIAVKENGDALPGMQNGTKGAKLVVFGDPDMKRSVNYLESITFHD